MVRALVGDVAAGIPLASLVLHDLPKVEPALRLLLLLLNILGRLIHRKLQHLVDLFDGAGRHAHLRGLVDQHGVGRLRLVEGHLLQLLLGLLAQGVRRAGEGRGSLRLRLASVEE